LLLHFSYTTTYVLDIKLTILTVVWTVTPLFANWISSPQNFLSTHHLLTPSSTILELGAGVSGIVALALGPQVAKYTATDQSYVLKLLRQNITENLDTVLPPKQRSTRKKNPTTTTHDTRTDRITATELDWETSSISHLPAVDLVIACDCIYNEALIEPLNSTCASLCRLRGEEEKPTLCLIAQQLRSPDVFEAWLKSFNDKFWCWQVPDEWLGEGLREGSGFVVHVGIVR
jgi:hypothetical protein